MEAELKKTQEYYRSIKLETHVRRLIYTANAFEGFNRQLRKITKTKSVSPIDDGRGKRRIGS